MPACCRPAWRHPPCRAGSVSSRARIHRAAGLQRGGPQQVNLECRGRIGAESPALTNRMRDDRRAECLVFRQLRPDGAARVRLASESARPAACRRASWRTACPVRSAPLIAVAGKVRAGRPAANVGIFRGIARGAIPVGRICGVLERNAAVGEILREAAPGGEVELVGLLQLRQIAFETRPFGQQAEDAPLVEHVDVVFPDHVIDGARACGRRRPAAASGR